MSRRFSTLTVVVGLAILSLLLILPILTFRIVVGILLAVVIGFLLRSFLSRPYSSAGFTEVSQAGQKTESDFALARLLEATMTGIREGMIVVDVDMTVIASNRAGHQLFPLGRGNLNSQRLTELTRNPLIYSAFLDALNKGTERSGLRIEMPDRRVFDLRVVPLANVDGSGRVGALGVFFDISRLDRLEKVRQEFLSNVSHELRTPLTAILAFVETLETGGLDDEENSRRFLEIIRKNASRMHHLIDDILELSAIEAGNVQVKSEEIELHAIVSDVINSLTAKASARHVTLINDVTADVTVFADARRLEQMLTNLIDNAIKFNREGGRVTIKHEDGQRDRILVEDTGEGIPAHHLERLFERFYRVDRARSRDLGGTGLGLAIVKHLARAHAGEVTVESTLGEGSVFTIDLPRAKPEECSTAKSGPIANVAQAGAD
jgi:two-component system, OmpR family, phosphate regulon sensor histidine kinase PhoR